MNAILSRFAAVASLRAVKWSAAAVAALVLAAVALVYGLSESRLARVYEVPHIALRTGDRPASAERGARWAKIFACEGCHKQAGGVLFDRGPFVARLVTPNLTRVAADYTDQELVVLLRAGIKRDRTSAAGMPTDSYAWMADEDVADIIAWLRALKPLPDATDATTFWGPMVRWAIASDRFKLSAELAHGADPPVRQPQGPGAEHGRYLHQVLCAHCHRLNEQHTVRPGTVAPALAPVAQSYDLEQFRRLLRTGKPLGDRELDLMSEVAVGSLSGLDDEEISSLHAYLMSVELIPEE